MDVFETDTNEGLTPEQFARIKALESASRILAERSSSPYNGTRSLRDAALSLAVPFYEWIMNG